MHCFSLFTIEYYLDYRLVVGRMSLTRGAVGEKSSSSCSYLGNNQQKRKGEKMRLLS
jgi:hypothetical protein